MSTEILVPEELSPEASMVIEAYIQNGSDIKVAAQSIGMSEEAFLIIYKRPEVRSYINTVFYESGFRNRTKFFDILDTVLTLKLEELQASGMGSSMDIMEILSKMHKMKMDEMKLEAQLRTAETAKSPIHQTNIQNNFPGGHDSGYMDLLGKLGSGKYK